MQTSSQTNTPPQSTTSYRHVRPLPLAKQLHAHWFDVNLHFPDQEAQLQHLQLRIQELQSVEILRAAPSGKRARYLVTVRVPLPFNLAPNAQHLRDPVIVSVRLDNSVDGQTWVPAGVFHALLEPGQTKAMQASQDGMVSRLVVGVKLIPALDALATPD